MAQQRFTAGIIGLGFGRGHIPAFQTNGVDVVAVCQRDRAAAEAVAAKYGVPRVFERWEQLLAEARPDIVVIAAPPHLHRAIALAAFDGGAHVLCEKPLAMTAAQGRDMVAAAARARRVAMTSFNWRFPAAMQRFHTMVEAGHVGRPFHIGARWLGGRLADQAAPGTWRMHRDQAGHGAMGDAGVHVIDLIRWSFGEFSRVTADAGIAYPDRSAPGETRAADAEDFCSVMAELASGARVTFTVSRVARGITEQTLECYGTAGALSYRMDRAGRQWYRGELKATGEGGGELSPVRVAARLPSATGEGDQLEVTGKATIGPLVARFLTAIRTGEPTSPSLEDGVRAQEVLDAVLESLRIGGWVRVRPTS
jgi:predicted dehydrogenase